MLQELFAPAIKTFQTCIAEIGKTFPCFLYGFFPFQMGFRIELISKANDLFFQTYRKHIPVRYRQVLRNDIVQ